MSLVHIIAFLKGCLSCLAMVYSLYSRSARKNVGYCWAKMRNGYVMKGDMFSYTWPALGGFVDAAVANIAFKVGSKDRCS